MELADGTAVAKFDSTILANDLAYNLDWDLVDGLPDGVDRNYQGRRLLYLKNGTQFSTLEYLQPKFTSGFDVFQAGSLAGYSLEAPASAGERVVIQYRPTINLLAYPGDIPAKYSAVKTKIGTEFLQSARDRIAVGYIFNGFLVGNSLGPVICTDYAQYMYGFTWLPVAFWVPVYTIDHLGKHDFFEHKSYNPADELCATVAIGDYATSSIKQGHFLLVGDRYGYGWNAHASLNNMCNNGIGFSGIEPICLHTVAISEKELMKRGLSFDDFGKDKNSTVSMCFGGIDDEGYLHGKYLVNSNRELIKDVSAELTRDTTTPDRLDEWLMDYIGAQEMGYVNYEDKCNPHNMKWPRMPQYGNYNVKTLYNKNFYAGTTIDGPGQAISNARYASIHPQSEPSKEDRTMAVNEAPSGYNVTISEPYRIHAEVCTREQNSTTKWVYLERKNVYLSNIFLPLFGCTYSMIDVSSSSNNIDLGRTLERTYRDNADDYPYTAHAYGNTKDITTPNGGSFAIRQINWPNVGPISQGSYLSEGTGEFTLQTDGNAATIDLPIYSTDWTSGVKHTFGPFQDIPEQAGETVEHQYHTGVYYVQKSDGKPGATHQYYNGGTETSTMSPTASDPCPANVHRTNGSFEGKPVADKRIGPRENGDDIVMARYYQAIIHGKLATGEWVNFMQYGWNGNTMIHYVFADGYKFA